MERVFFFKYIKQLDAGWNLDFRGQTIHEAQIMIYYYSLNLHISVQKRETRSKTLRNGLISNNFYKEIEEYSLRRRHEI